MTREALATASGIEPAAVEAAEADLGSVLAETLARLAADSAWRSTTSRRASPSEIELEETSI